MVRLRLGIDMDGVIVDFNAGWIRLYNEEFGDDLRPEDAVMWSSPTALTAFETMGQFWRWARDCSHGASLFRHLDPYPGALDAVDRLAGDHDIVIVTTKPRYAVEDTMAWLADHEVPATEVHIVDDKTTVDCDVYLDDSDDNIVALGHHRRDAVVCRFVRPWNRHHEGTVPVEDWGQFEHVVERVAAAFDDGA